MTTDAGTLSEPTRTDEVPIFGWEEFLAGADGVVEGEGVVVGHRTEMSRGDGGLAGREAGRPLRHHLHLGDDRPAQGGHDHPRPDPADLRHLGLDRRAWPRATAT